MSQINNMTVKYVGERQSDGCVVRAYDAKSNSYRLPLRLDLANHSPTGFEWGYAGSGPAQLALAILADATGDDERALRLHQFFKRDFIQDLSRNGTDGWVIFADEVLRWVQGEGKS